MPLLTPPVSSAESPLLGDLLDRLDVRAKLPASSQPIAAVVVLELAGSSLPVLATSDGLSWPDLLGLLDAGRLLAENQRPI